MRLQRSTCSSSEQVRLIHRLDLLVLGEQIGFGERWRH